MSNSSNPMQFDTAQIDSMFFAPARAFAALSADYTEKLVNTQLEATKAYADTNLSQLRGLMEVKDAEGLKSYMESQQKIANEMTERMKQDAEKLVALQQEFAAESQKLTESSVKQAQESAKETTESAAEAVKEAAPKAAPKTSK